MRREITRYALPRLTLRFTKLYPAETPAQCETATMALRTGTVPRTTVTKGFTMDEHKPNANQPAATDTTRAAADTTPATTGTARAASANRRSLFKRLGIATLIGGLAAGIGFKAFAGGHGCHARGGFMAGSVDPAAMNERLERMLKHLYVEIDATEAQKQKLGPILKQAANDLLPLRGKMHAARTQATELLTRDSIDRAALETLRAEQLQQADLASRRISQALADAAEVLTPAQRKQLAARIEHHRRGWHQG
jgi:protein CpxP